MADTNEPEDRRDGMGTGREISTEGIRTDPEVGNLRDADAETNQEGSSVQEETDSDIEERDTERFYKSQKEIDRAIGRRLASERRRWEREHQEKSDRSFSEGGGSLWLSEKGMYAGEYNFYANLVAQGNALSGGDSGFDLLGELKENPAFEKLVSSGIPVSEAYEMAGKARLMEKEQLIRRDERRKMTEEIQSRNQGLPAVDYSAGRNSPVLDVTRMTDEELNRLAERVRKGERVVI